MITSATFEQTSIPDIQIGPKYQEERRIKTPIGLEDSNPFKAFLGDDSGNKVEDTGTAKERFAIKQEDSRKIPVSIPVQVDDTEGDSGQYSVAYIRYMTKNVALEIRNEFQKWASTEDEYKLLHIRNAKVVIDKNIDLLEHSAESRIFIGTLELLFSNNEWRDLESFKVQLVADAITRYASSKMTFGDLNSFRNQMLETGLNIIV